MNGTAGLCLSSRVKIVYGGVKDSRDGGTIIHRGARGERAVLLHPHTSSISFVPSFCMIARMKGESLGLRFHLSPKGVPGFRKFSAAQTRGSLDDGMTYTITRGPASWVEWVGPYNNALAGRACSPSSVPWALMFQAHVDLDRRASFFVRPWYATEQIRNRHITE